MAVFVASPAHPADRAGPLVQVGATVQARRINSARRCSANFLPTGATTANLYVQDKYGKFRDVLLGYDNHVGGPAYPTHRRSCRCLIQTNYVTSAVGRNFFSPIVGRYANRIKNSTFTVDGHKYNISANEHGGLDTLHGGAVGYGIVLARPVYASTERAPADLRNWTIAKQSANSVTFNLIDVGFEGFPGTVNTSVTYTLQNHAALKINMHATASQNTPLMLSVHNYWNLEVGRAVSAAIEWLLTWELQAYQESQDLIGHYAQFDADRVIATDGILIPNGTLIDVTNTPLDFRKAKSIGVAIPDTAPYQYCGSGGSNVISYQ
jgi:aldose 1-epimerase